MEIVTKFFPKVMVDNELAYLSHLEGIISSVDEMAIMEIVKNPHSYHFRLVPSVPKYSEMLLEEILKFHTMLNIRLDLSKSIKSSGGTIVFDISIE
jgi:hypothetical protein